jgi:hypothetical protein
MGIPTAGLKNPKESGRDYSARFFFGMVINIEAMMIDANGATAKVQTVAIPHIAMNPVTALKIPATRAASDSISI